MEWHPIETAPKDWTDLVLYCPEDDDGSGARGISLGWFSMRDGGFDCWMAPDGPCKPTHWMPLPAPPKQD